MGALVLCKDEHGPKSYEGITRSQPCLTIIDQRITNTITLAHSVASHSVVQSIVKPFRAMSSHQLTAFAW